MPVKIVTKCSTPARTAASRSSPAFTCLRTAPRRPLSVASPALAVSTFAASPDTVPALRRKPSATARAASSYAASAASASAYAEPSNRATAAGETSARTTSAGA